MSNCFSKSDFVASGKTPFWQSAFSAQNNPLFENPAQKFDRNQNSSTKTRKTNVKQLDFSKFIISREKLAWHEICVFGSPAGKTWPKIWKGFCSKYSMRIEKISGIFQINRFPGHVESNIDTLAKSFWQNCNGFTQ